MPIHVLELYSGIGGHHAAYSLIERAKRLEDGSDHLEAKFHAFDVNENANTAYAFNFPDPPSSTDISQLKASDFDAIGASLWVMSPPCQPYTRNGSRLNSKDARAHSFISLLEEIPHMKSPPTHILLENVLGFETSDSFEILCKVLTSCDFTWQGFIINPNDCGFPNSRPRFYLLAKHKSLAFGVPAFNLKFDNPPCAEIGIPVKPATSISTFMDADADFDALKLSHRQLWKAGEQYDILRPTHTRGCCFTKGYGDFARGTGSVLCLASDEEIVEGAKRYGHVAGEEVVGECKMPQLNWDGVAEEDVMRALKFLFQKYFAMRKEGKPVHDPVAGEGNVEGVKPRRVSAKRRREIDMERGSWPDKLEECPLAVLKLRHFSVKE
ncbi:C-5 cytosine-specific DNA methylase, partial [Podochytrium sp. JEL0797]